MVLSNNPQFIILSPVKVYVQHASVIKPLFSFILINLVNIKNIQIKRKESLMMALTAGIYLLMK